MSAWRQALRLFEPPAKLQRRAEGRAFHKIPRVWIEITREMEIWFADEGMHQPDEEEQARQTTLERQVHRITRTGASVFISAGWY